MSTAQESQSRYHQSQITFQPRSMTATGYEEVFSLEELQKIIIDPSFSFEFDEVEIKFEEPTFKRKEKPIVTDIRYTRKRGTDLF